MHTIFIAREQPAVSDNMLHGARVGAAADDKRLAFLIARLTSVNLQKRLDHRIVQIHIQRVLVLVQYPSDVVFFKIFPGVQHLLHLKSKSKILRPIEIMGFFYEISCQIQGNNLL